MREQAEKRELARFKLENPVAVQIQRHALRARCDWRLAQNPGWVPTGELLRWLRVMDIDDEYINITPHCFVTARMPQSQTIEEVYEKVKDLKYTWLEGSEAVLEGFNTSNPHVHFLVPSKVHKGNIIKQFSNRFRIKKQFVDYKQSDCPQLFQKRQEYIRGTKQTNKSEKVLADVEFRNAHNIPHLISF